MTTELLQFAIRGVDLTAAVAPLGLAIVLGLLIRTKVQALLVVLNLWLFAELAATLLEPGYEYLAALRIGKLRAQGTVSIRGPWNCAYIVLQSGEFFGSERLNSGKENRKPRPALTLETRI